MSVYYIQIRNGKKMMLPVASRQEYMALRDSDRNRRADKRHMLQCCYSCEPNDDGTLRGSTRMSSSVGMDIDLTEAEAADQAGSQALIDLILSRKEEIGLLMLERSATKGFHLVFRRVPALTQEQNLRRVSDLLGIPYDQGAKDITRVFYTPADKLLFLDDALFLTEEPSAVPSIAGDSIPDISSASAQSSSSSEAPSPAALHAFDLCVRSAGLNPEAMDVWGQHNWHSNLMAVLSVGLPKLMSREQLLAVVADRLPNYSQTADCRLLIDYFYEKYTADKGFMSVSLREINSKAQLMASQSADDAEAEAEAELEQITAGWAPPAVPKRLPHLLNLLTGNYDQRFRQMLLLSALPVLSAHASHFRARYINGKVIGPQQFVAVIGGSGQGKGNCTDLFREMVQYTLQENDEREWDKVAENLELRDKKANAKERPPKYHPKLRLFETTSKSSILELQSNLGRNGMLLGQFSEVDGLSAASRTSYSDISVLLRKGWDGDMHRQFYMSDATCNTYTQMNISLLMAGTVKAMLERFFSDANCEGGLMQRTIPVILPKTKRTFRPPEQNFLSDDEKRERDSLLLSLYTKDLALGDDTYVLDTPLTNRAIGQWFDSLEERYNDGQLTEAEADLSHRCGEFMLRAAIPLIALYGKETKEIVDFARWVGETAHYAMCRIFGLRVQNDISAADEILAARSDARKTAEPLLSGLPEVFTADQLKELRVRTGQSPDVRMLLSRYCRAGKIEKVARGVYRKCNIITVTKMSDCTPSSGIAQRSGQSGLSGSPSPSVEPDSLLSSHEESSPFERGNGGVLNSSDYEDPS